jgi:hypothetical protein
MLETHLRSPVTQARLRSGPAADHVDHFADWLGGRGYRPRCIEDFLRALAGWTDWMCAAGFTAHDDSRPSAPARWSWKRSRTSGIGVGSIASA